MKILQILIISILFINIITAQEKTGYFERVYNNVYDDVLLSFDDAVSFYAKPLKFNSTDWMIAGGSVAATYGLIYADKDLRKFFGRNTLRSYNNDFWDYPTYYGVADYANYFSASMYAIGVLADQQELRTTGRMLIESILISGSSVMVIRSLLGRNRPMFTEDQWDFVGFKLVDEYMSFPSGHSTVAFALSTVLAERIDTWWSRVLFYGAASLSSYARLYNNQHWFTDIITGSAFGLGAGLYVVNRENDRNGKAKEQAFEIVPSVNGLSFYFRF